MIRNWKTIVGLVSLVLIGSLLSFSPIPNSVTENYQKVQEAYTDGDLRTQAAKTIEIAQELSWRKDLLVSAGQMAYQAGDLELALSAFQEADRRGVLSPMDRLIVGDVYLAAGKPSKAENIWKQLSGIQQAHDRLANLYETQGNYQAAILQWQAWEKKQTGKLPLEFNRHLGLLLAVEDPAAALPYLETAADKFPDAAAIADVIRESSQDEIAYQLMLTGQVLGKNDHWRIAVRAFEHAVEQRPDYLEAWAYLGEALQHIPDPDRDPLIALQTAQGLNEESPLVNMFLGLYWQRNDKHLTALDYFQKAAGSWPEQPDVYVEIGRSLAVTGELDEAFSNFQKAVEISDGSGIYYRQLAAFCVEYSYQVKQVGLPAAREAVILSDEGAEDLTVMGEVLLHLEDQQNAWNFFYRAVKADPTYAPAHFQLAILYAADGEDRHAAYHIDQVFQHSQNPVLINRAERLDATLSP